MSKTRIITKKLKLILLAVWLLMSNLSPAMALESPNSQRYTEMTFVKGSDPDLMLYVNKKSLNIDLLRTNNIRVRIKTSGVYNAIEKISSFKISMYEIINGERQFISSQTLTVFKGTKKSRIVSIAAGYFAAPVKQVEFDVFDTEGNLINTYATELSATNLASQVSGGEGAALGSAECDYTNFDDCQLDYLFNRITFEAKPQKQISTRIIKSEEGLYKVTIPVPRSQFKFLGRSVTRGKKDRPPTDNGGNGGGLSADSFGETLSISNIQIGPDANNFGVISYDPDDGQFTFGPTNAITPVVIGADGKVGIGVDPANAFLDVRGGDGTTPSMILEPGILAAAPPNGALEFDGNNIYFTKGGVRSPIGERGATGGIGPTGATGPQGPQGPSGAISLAANTNINGDLTFINGALLENATLNGTLAIKPGSVITVNGVTFEGPHITFNGTVFSDTFNATLFNGTTFNGVTANFTTVNATNFTGTNLSGNGAGLTNVDASTLNGLDFTDFLRSNLSDTYTGVELDFSAASKLDLNGDLEIADTMIEFNGGGTTFNGSGAFNIKPAADMNVNINTSANGDFIVKNSLIFAEGHNGNVGIGLTEPPEKLTVNGILALREGNSIPPDSAGYGKLYVKTADAKIYFHGSDGMDYDLTAASSGSGPAGTLDGLDSTEFLRSNDNTTYTTGIFTINSGTTFDVNSGNVSIRDNSINFDTVTSTTFNGSGAFTIRPMSGSNLNVNLATTGDLIVNTNDLVVDTSAGFIGLGTASPQQPLHINAAGLGSSNASVLMTAKEGSNWIYGVDNGDSSKFKLANGNSLTTNVVFTALKSGNIGIGYINPLAKLHVNGEILATVFNGSFIGNGKQLTGVVAATGNATTLDNLDSSVFLRSNLSDTYTGLELDFSAASKLDLNGDLEIADTMIEFDGSGPTTFNGANAIYLQPNNGSNLNIDLLGLSDFTVDANKFVVNNNGNVGVGYVNPQSKLHVNGQILATVFNGNFIGNGKMLTGVAASPAGADTQVQFRDGVVTGADADFTWNKTTNNLTITNQIISASAKFTSGAAANYLLKSDAAGNGSWADPSSLSVSNASLLDNLDSSVFLRSNLSDTYTGTELDFSAASKLDLNGDLEIADTMIEFDGSGPTTFNGANAIYIQPNNGSNLNIDLLGLSDFTVDVNKFVVNNNGNVGVGYVNPQSKLHVNGQILATVFNGNFIGNGKMLTGVAASPAGADTQVQFRDGVITGADADFTWNKTTNDLTIANQIISASARFTTGAVANYLLKSDGSGNSSWVNPNAISVSNASLLDNIDSSAFLRSNLSDTFNGVELDFSAASKLDLNGDLEIADTMIEFDGGDTTFNGSGAFTLFPNNGSNLSVRLDGLSDFAVDVNKFIVNNNGNVGVGYVNPQSKLHVNGQVLATVFNGSFIGNGKQLTGVVAATGNSTTLDNLDSSAFLRSNLSDTYTGVELDFSAGSKLDLNGDLEIADTMIEFDGGDTTFNGNGAFTLFPNNGSNLSVRLDGTSDFIIDTNKFKVENDGNVGIGYVSPQSKLHVNGQILATTFNGTFIGSGAGLSGVNANPGGSSTQLQYNNGGLMAGTANLTWTKATSTLKFASGTSLQVNGDLTLGDANIRLDANSTKFTQTTGAIQMIPGSGATFTVNGALTLVPSAVALISVGSSIPASNSIIKIVGNPGAVNITFNPQIADGVHGQVIIIRGTNNTSTVTLEEGNGLALTDGLSFILGNKDTMSLMYDASDDQWIEISRSDK